MAYYLRQDKKKKGTYLQMYESYWDKEKKQPRSRNIESFGYVSNLISNEIPDPVSYYQKYVEKKNREHADSVADQTRPRAFTAQLEKNIGYFLASSLLSELNVRETIDILASQKRFQFDLYDMIAQLIYARILYPCSKSKTAQTITLKLTFQRKINKRDLPRKTGMDRSSGRPCFWMRIWFHLRCRCIQEMSQRNRISGRSYRK